VCLPEIALPFIRASCCSSRREKNNNNDELIIIKKADTFPKEIWTYDETGDDILFTNLYE
jgi:hypothetical protein